MSRGDRFPQRDAGPDTEKTVFPWKMGRKPLPTRKGGQAGQRGDRDRDIR